MVTISSSKKLRNARKFKPSPTTVLGIAIVGCVVLLVSFRPGSSGFDLYDGVGFMWNPAAYPPAAQPAIVSPGWTRQFKMPPFDTVHDFSTGPRPQRVVVGYTKEDILQGRGLSFQDYDEGTVDMSIFHSPQSSVPFLAKEKNTTQRFAGMTREQPTDGYSAAWLVTTDRLMENSRINTTHLREAEKIRLEYGDFAMSENSWNLQSVDMFDFFVHHLSYFEKVIGRSDELTTDTIKLLEEMQVDYERTGFYNNPSKERNGHTLAIVAYNAVNEEGASLLRSQLFLNITVKTVAAIFPNVVLFVGDQSDYDYVTKHSGLNRYMYDVHLMKDLRTFHHITYGTSVTAKELLRQGYYNKDDFQFIYYTEADELPHMRNVHYLLRHALQKPPSDHPNGASSSVLIPHRGQPLPTPRDVSPAAVKNAQKLYDQSYLNGKRKVHQVPDTLSSSCCFLRPSTKHGKFVTPQEFLPMANPKMEIFQQHRSFTHVAGTGNMFTKFFWLCEISKPRQMCLKTGK